MKRKIKTLLTSPDVQFVLITVAYAAFYALVGSAT